MPQELKTLTPADFARALGEELTPRLKTKIDRLDLKYTELSLEERDHCLKRIVETLLDPDLEYAGAHRLPKWEKGWSDNLRALQAGETEALVPAYFRGDQIVRWQQRFIRPARPGFDYNALAVILEWLFEKYMLAAASVYEFGCGTGHHLVHLREINPTAKLYGLDWAESSQKIIQTMVQSGKLANASSRRFDFFSPDKSLILDPGSVVYTVAALEQMGADHGPFVEYLLANRPGLCVHVEPLAELLDTGNLLDYLVIEYFRRRNYLSGFLTSLRKLEGEGKLSIRQVQRTGIGGNIFIEGYMLVVWEPR